MTGLGYFQPQTVEEAVNFLGKHPDTAKILAGGTDLFVKMKGRTIRPLPEVLVDISRIKSLREIAVEQGWLRIGPLLCHREISESALIKEKAAVLARAAGEVGSPQIRNRGTVGGNVMNASPAADTVPALLVLDAQVQIRGPEYGRVLALSDFFTGPGTTALLPGELIEAFKVRPIAPEEGTAFLKIGRRKALIISITNGAVWLRVEKGMIAAARIALGAVAPTPVRLEQVEKWLAGKPAGAQVFAEAGSMASKMISPIDDVRGKAVYRRSLAKVIVARCLQTAWEQVQEVM